MAISLTSKAGSRRSNTKPSLGKSGVAVGSEPKLALDFSVDLPSSVSFTRGSIGTYFDKNGVMQTAKGANQWVVADAFSGTGISASGSSIVFSGASSLSNGRQTTGVIPIEDKTYEITYTVSNYSSGAARIILYGATKSITGITYSANGTYTEILTVSTAGGSFPNTITFQNNSGSTGTFTISNVIVRKISDIPRIDHDPATGVCKGLLIEESRTNLLAYSRDMTNGWGGTNRSVSRNQVGIDGVANTACTIDDGTATGNHYIQQYTVANANNPITISAYLKAGTISKAELRLNTSAGGAIANIDLVAKTCAHFNTYGTGYGTGTGTITDIGGGWFRCTYTNTTTDTNAVSGSVFTRNAGGSDSYTGTNGTLIVDCFQLEVGTFATSYIPTTTAAVTRSADAASMTGTNFSSWWNASAGTFMTETISASASSTNNRVVSAYGASANEQISIAGDITRVRSGGSDIGSFYTTTIVVGKRAIAYATNDQAAAKDGAYSSSTNAGLPSGIVTLWIGVTNASTAYLNGHIRRLTYWPKRLANNVLQAITK
jgi:hypothetical protein